MFRRVLPLILKISYFKNNSAFSFPVAVNKSVNSPSYFSRNLLIWNRESVLNMSSNADSVDDDSLKEPRRHLDYQQLLNKKKGSNVVLIDVREHSEINETGKLPGSIHIPLGELEQTLSTYTDEQFKAKFGTTKPVLNTEIIFSCRSGGRSLKALKLALKLGYTNAGHYTGGWQDWSEKTKS